MTGRILLNEMSEAPKDGTKIIIVWSTPNNDISYYNIREAWWWKPTVLHQWESGARPHWTYIDDDEFTREISKPLGWVLAPSFVRINGKLKFENDVNIPCKNNKPDILTIDKCIEYLVKNADSFNKDSHSKLTELYVYLLVTNDDS